MHQCDRCSSDMTTWQSIVGQTWRSIQWLQRSRRCEGSSVRKYNVCFLFLRLHHFNASQTYLDHVHKSTEKHQELQLQLLKIKDQVHLYSLQPLAAPAQATKDATTFQAPRPEAATSSQGPFQQTIPRASQRSGGCLSYLLFGVKYWKSLAGRWYLFWTYVTYIVWWHQHEYIRLL